MANPALARTMSPRSDKGNRILMKMLLLVDDNAEVRRLLKSMLAQVADEIHEASNGLEAIALYRAARPELVVMDIFMTPVDGLAAAKEIKKIDPAARIIFISNHTDNRTRLAAHEVGAEALFGKDDLLSLVEFLEN